MVKGFRQIALLTVISRIFGLLRDMAYAYYFGASGLMDCWTIAFKIPNLARRIFGEGAASSSFIPIYSTQLQKDPASAKDLRSTVVSVITVILTSIVLIGEIIIVIWYFYFAEYDSTLLTLKLTAIMLPYMILICVVAIIAGILNSHRHFAAPAAAPILLNLFIIIALVLSGIWIKHSPAQFFVAAVAVVSAGIAQLLIQIPALTANKIKLRPAWKTHDANFKKILFLMAPMIIGLTATQLNTLADDLIAKFFSGSPEKGQFLYWFGCQIKYPLWDGAVSNLYYSQRLYQFPLGVIGISLATAIFPVMSQQAGNKDYKSMLETLSTGIKGSVFVALPATAGLILVSKPLVALVFQRGQFTAQATQETSYTLWFYAIGLTAFFSQQIIIRAFYSLHDAKMPSISALIAVTTNVILNLTLIWFMGKAGLALSTSICSYLQIAILLMVLRKKFGNNILNGILPITIKTIIATTIMSLAGLLIIKTMTNLPHDKLFEAIRLLAIIVTCATVYTLLAVIMKNPMLSLVIHRRIKTK